MPSWHSRAALAPRMSSIWRPPTAERTLACASSATPFWSDRSRSLRPRIARCTCMQRPWRKPSASLCEFSPPAVFSPTLRQADVPSRNLITDVPGVRVGHADDHSLGSGVTAIVFDAPAVAAMDVRGGGPGTREAALLDPANTVERIDAIALSGGSAFGLDAASGVQAYLREQGRGFAVRGAVVPIVPGAILFDLLNGGDKDWGRFPPYRDLGYR